MREMVIQECSVSAMARAFLAQAQHQANTLPCMGGQNASAHPHCTSRPCLDASGCRLNISGCEGLLPPQNYRLFEADEPKTFVEAQDAHRRSSAAGNGTRVFCVTGRNTDHYTTAD